MRLITIEELFAVAGGLQSVADEHLGAAAINAPNCPEGYVGVVLTSQTVVEAHNVGVTTSIGVNGFLPAANLQGSVPAGTTSTTAAQYCIPDLSRKDNSDRDAACVHKESFLSCGKLAKDIKVGDVMQLSDERTLAPGEGTVTYSALKTTPGYRIITESGTSLVCSDTAPIPTTDGIILAPNVLAKSVAVRHDHNNSSEMVWEKVTAVESVGEIEVQHITVGDKCFWAGEKQHSYILHHNIKQQTVFTSDGRVVYDGFDVTNCF